VQLNILSDFSGISPGFHDAPEAFCEGTSIAGIAPASMVEVIL
jgi:hypothetical protein